MSTLIEITDPMNDDGIAVAESQGPVGAAADAQAAPPTVPPTFTPDAETLAKIQAQLERGHELAAIKTYRDAAGDPRPSLADAKTAIAAYQAEAAWAAISKPDTTPEADPPDIDPPAPDATVTVTDDGFVQVDLAPPAPTGRRVQSRGERDIRVVLTDVEFAAAAKALAAMEGEIAALDATHAAARKEMREAQAEADGRRARLAAIVRDGVEVRRVEVIVEVDYDAGVVRDLDANGRVYGERPMEGREAQVPLFAPDLGEVLAHDDAGEEPANEVDGEE